LSLKAQTAQGDLDTLEPLWQEILVRSDEGDS